MEDRGGETLSQGYLRRSFLVEEYYWGDGRVSDCFDILGNFFPCLDGRCSY